MIKEKANILNNKTITSVTSIGNDRKLVQFNDNSSMEVDMIVYGIGDSPNTGFLDSNLISSSNKGVEVNKYL